MLILGTPGEGGNIYRQGIHNCFLICFPNSSAFSLIAAVGAGAGAEKTNGIPGPPSSVCALCEISWSKLKQAQFRSGSGWGLQDLPPAGYASLLALLTEALEGALNTGADCPPAHPGSLDGCGVTELGVFQLCSLL